MKKLLLILLALMPFAASAQTVRLKDLFAEMPDSLLPTLTRSNRLDFIDYRENRMLAKVRNRLDEFSVMDTLSDHYLSITLSEASRVEMLMTDSDSICGAPLIFVCSTFDGPASESVLRCYNTDWTPCTSIALPAPKVPDFLDAYPDSVATQMSGIRQCLEDLPMVCISICPDSNEMEYNLQTCELDRDDKPTAELYVKPLAYKIDDIRRKR